MKHRAWCEPRGVYVSHFRSSLAGELSQLQTKSYNALSYTSFYLAGVNQAREGETDLSTGRQTTAHGLNLAHHFFL